MEISLLPPENIVSVAREIESVTDQTFVESDFLLRAFKVVNTSSERVQINCYRFNFKAKGKVQNVVLHPEDAVAKSASGVSSIIGQLTREGPKRKKIQQRDNFHRLMGTDAFWVANQVSSSNILSPQQETGLLSKRFRVLADAPIDELLIEVDYTENGKPGQTSVTIPVMKKEKREDYIFPVKGQWLVTWNWVGLDSHREAYSQEFAFDLIKMGEGPLEEGAETLNSEDPCYGEDILAIADGRVTSCFDGIPDNPAVGVHLPVEQIREIIDTYESSLPAGAGNHVVLQHSSGECSFYAHMIPGSVMVKEGDKVKQGQVIGRVGNSGNSDGPHLHFHLMDGPDYFTSRGLPCHFTNVRNLYGESLEIVDVDNSPVWAE